MPRFIRNTNLRLARPVLSWFALLILLVPGTVSADSIKAFKDGDSKVSAKDMASVYEKNRSKEGYLQRWLLRVKRDDGGWMQISYVLTNLGPGSGRAVVDIMRYGPSLDAEGGEKVFKRRSKKHLPKEWTAGTQKLDLKLGDSWLKTKGRGFVGYAKAWDRHAEFTIKGQGARWQPGDGTIHYPGKGIFTQQVLTSRARIQGREKKRDGEWRPFKGTVSVEHSIATLLPYQMAKNLLRFEGKAGPYVVHFQELTTPPMWADEKFGWMVVSKGSKIVAESFQAVATVKKYRTAKTNAGAKHRVPSKYRVEAQTPEGPIVLDVKTRSNIHVEDLLAALNKPVRLVLQVFIQPVNVFDRAKMRLVLPGNEKKYNGKGMALYGTIFGK